MMALGDRRVSWLDLSTERLFSHTSVNLIFRKGHKNCLPLSAHRPQVVLPEHITATCLSGIPRKKCNASLKQRVPKLDFVQFSLRNRQPAQAGSTQHVTLNRHRGEKLDFVQFWGERRSRD